MQTVANIVGRSAPKANPLDNGLRPPLVSFIGVHKNFGARIQAVRDLSLEVRGGEFLTLLGPSGSGKTTSLMLLAGFESCTSGDILIGGKSIRNVPPHRRGIGVVFQNYALFPHMTVGENLAFPLLARRYGKREIKEKVTRALELVRLPGFESRKPHQLSGGKQQRIALARALVFEPSLVLMDEPLGALDKQLREQMQIELKRIHRSLGLTVVYVTHDQSEALTMSDQVAVFSEGRVEQLGAPREIYERPASLFVASFVGENNILKGTALATAGGYVIRVDTLGAIKAEPVDAAAGAPAAAAIRPEAITINGTAGPHDNVVAGTVRDVIYHGDHTRALVTVGAAIEIMVKIPKSTAPAVLEPGASVQLCWSARDCRAFTLRGEDGWSA